MSANIFARHSIYDHIFPLLILNWLKRKNERFLRFCLVLVLWFVSLVVFFHIAYSEKSNNYFFTEVQFASSFFKSSHQYHLHVQKASCIQINNIVNLYQFMANAISLSFRKCHFHFSYLKSQNFFIWRKKRRKKKGKDKQKKKKRKKT